MQGEGDSLAVRIGKLFQLLVDRLKQTKGMQPLSETDGEYFTSVAWNTGLEAVKKGEDARSCLLLDLCVPHPLLFPDHDRRGPSE